MKIYNKIIIEWNDETLSYDKVVYEDSYEYEGELMLAEIGCPACVDGSENEYDTVVIGSSVDDYQCWMASNLRTRKYQSGESIPQYGIESSHCLEGGFGYETCIDSCECWTTTQRGGQTSNPDFAAVLDIYGRHYNWYAVAGIAEEGGAEGAQELCPTEWHVPSDAEWIVMEEAIGMCPGEAEDPGYPECDDWPTEAGCCSEDASFRGPNQGGMLKVGGEQYWEPPNECGPEEPS